MHLRQWRSFGSTNCDVGELERARPSSHACSAAAGFRWERAWKWNGKGTLHCTFRGCICCSAVVLRDADRLTTRIFKLP